MSTSRQRSRLSGESSICCTIHRKRTWQSKTESATCQGRCWRAIAMRKRMTKKGGAVGKGRRRSATGGRVVSMALPENRKTHLQRKYRRQYIATALL
jgi:hypothetical protein